MTRIRMLVDYDPGNGGRTRVRNELLTVPDERGREMIALGLAEAYGEPAPKPHPDLLPSDADSDQHE